MSSTNLFNYRTDIYSEAICPCLRCEERSEGCHGKCAKYAEFKAKLQTIKEEKNKGNVVTDYTEFRKRKRK